MGLKQTGDVAHGERRGHETGWWEKGADQMRRDWKPRKSLLPASSKGKVVTKLTGSAE